MPARPGLVARCAFLTFVAAGLARADDAVPLRLRYSAPASCPNAESFLGQVAARTPLARPARGGEPATSLIVSIRDVQGGSAGTLELRAPGSVTSTRGVSAAQCEQVVTALALMTALAIDPNASTAPVQEPPVAPPAKVAALGPAPPPPSGPLARWRWRTGASFEALGGVAPDPVLLVRPFFEVERERHSAWSPALRVSGGRAHAIVPGGSGAGEFTLWTGRLEGCPLRLSASRAVRLSPCLVVDAGQLRAVGNGISPAEQVDRPWLSAGLAGRLEFRLLEVLAIELAIELAGEVFFPIVRDRFFIDTDVTLYRAPPVAGGAVIGLGMQFP